MEFPASFNLEKNLFVGTSAAIDFGVDLSRTIIYLDNNYLRKEMLIYIPILLVASFGGSYVGRRLLGKIPQETFKKILLGLVLAMGLVMVISNYTEVILKSTKGILDNLLIIV